MYAIVKTGGKQYKVSEGQEIFVEKLEAEAGQEVALEVLAVQTGENLLLGEEATKATVTAEVVKQGKGKKIVVFKYKAKKGYRRKKGHRQPYTRLKITKIAA